MGANALTILNGERGVKIHRIRQVQRMGNSSSV